jgi:enoyl-CoA hydratase
MAYETITYTVKDRVAHIELNRPHVLNAIVAPMPFEIRSAVSVANFDDSVHAVLLTGAGRSFCSGYDLKAYAERGELSQLDKKRYDAVQDFKFMGECTSAFYSLRESLKPTICAVQGHCVAGGSDIALCCDLVVMADDALIGFVTVSLETSPKILSHVLL